jgi:uncharacterized coiled-coil DUF342 family protein
MLVTQKTIDKHIAKKVSKVNKVRYKKISQDILEVAEIVKEIDNIDNKVDKMDDRILKIVNELNIIKDEIRDITNEIKDYKESSYFSFGVDKTDELINHLLIFKDRFNK